MHHKIAITATALLGFFAHVSTAASCTSANAKPVEDYISENGGSGSGAEIFLSDNPFDKFVSNAVKRRTTPNAQLANIAYAIQPRAADSVTCSATEMCLSVQKTPFCLDMMTGGFHDGTGTTGNALTGDYTLGDGRKGNLYNGPHPLPGGAEAPTVTTTTGAGSAATPAPGGGNGGGAAVTTGSGTVATQPTGTNAAALHDKPVGVVLGGLMAVVGAGLL
ncbi:hypothetical protein B0H66DRAFT_595676 [Apodospora peruviana]|uniref:Uncharacterized protein n=1 Tax=Apodospora peruviana TaxID=516989 RepID=A0AAE0HVA0_9PEZI|nr:hypothetical protein B0H66DRAFT_595676 [Apodospora peruviana]